MSRRRDYGRWEPWMGAVLLGVLIFFSVALLASGQFLLGAIGAGAAILTAVRRPR